MLGSLGADWSQVWTALNTGTDYDPDLTPREPGTTVMTLGNCQDTATQQKPRGRMGHLVHSMVQNQNEGSHKQTNAREVTPSCDLCFHFISLDLQEATQNLYYSVNKTGHRGCSHGWEYTAATTVTSLNRGVGSPEQLHFTERNGSSERVGTS